MDVKRGLLGLLLLVGVASAATHFYSQNSKETHETTSQSLKETSTVSLETSPTPMQESLAEVVETPEVSKPSARRSVSQNTAPKTKSTPKKSRIPRELPPKLVTTKTSQMKPSLELPEAAKNERPSNKAKPVDTQELEAPAPSLSSSLSSVSSAPTLIATPILQPKPESTPSPTPYPTPEPTPEPTVVSTPESAPISVPVALATPPVLVPTPTPLATPKSYVSSASDNKTPERPLWLILGAGFSYNSLKQDVSGISNLQVGQTSLPFLIAQMGLWLQQKLGVELGYHTLPGKVLSANGLTVSKDSYQWQTLSVEGLYRLKPSYEFSEPEWILRLGLQHHQVPFLVAQNANQIDLIQNNLTMASVGFKYLHPLNEKTRFEWMMRYQAPIAANSVAGSTIRLTSRLAFDGSVGARYKLSPQMSVGGYWSGQYLNYNFKYSDTSVQPVSGQQSLFQSNVSIRLEWEF